MPKVLTRSYSSYSDHITGIQFNAVKEIATDCFIAVADVPEDKLAAFTSRPAFQVITDAEYLAITTRPALAEPTGPAPGGDPLGAAPGPDPKATAAAKAAAKKADADAKKEAAAKAKAQATDAEATAASASDPNAPNPLDGTAPNS